MTIGEKIRKLRIDLGLTQEELADAVSTKKQTIHKYEVGIITNIPATKIKDIADKLKTTPAYLMGWDDIDSFSDNKEKLPHTVEEEQFLKMVARLTPENRAFLFRQAEFLLADQQDRE